MSTDPAGALDGLVEAGLELGAAVAVVRDGVVEIDHSVGTTNGSDAWRSDTLVMTFSVAKPFAALAFLDAVAEGLVSLDQPVATAWPEFARHGKTRPRCVTCCRTRRDSRCSHPRLRHVGYDDREALVALLADSPRSTLPAPASRSTR